VLSELRVLYHQPRSFVGSSDAEYCTFRVFCCGYCPAPPVQALQVIHFRYSQPILFALSSIIPRSLRISNNTSLKCIFIVAKLTSAIWRSACKVTSYTVRPFCHDNEMLFNPVHSLTVLNYGNAGLVTSQSNNYWYKFRVHHKYWSIKLWLHVQRNTAASMQPQSIHCI
jgi:hypothetical protein